MRYLAIVLAACLSLPLLPDSAPGQSFNCRNARNAAERAICNDAELSDLDEEADEYLEELREIIDDDELTDLRDAESDFIRRRNACGSNVACLIDEYEDWIDELLDWLEEYD